MRNAWLQADVTNNKCMNENTLPSVVVGGVVVVVGRAVAVAVVTKKNQ